MIIKSAILHVVFCAIKVCNNSLNMLMFNVYNDL